MDGLFRIKICGITNPTDAKAAAEAGADAVGLNFYPRSKRYLDLRRAVTVASAVPAHVVRIGVFVNATAEFVRMIAQRLGLGAVQLHGDESVEFLAELADLPLIRAFPLSESHLPQIRQYLAHCRQRGIALRMVLFDAAIAGNYGGTGRPTDWRLAAELALDPAVPPVVLAGGLTPENVGDAIRTVRPAAVDTAGGVESAPGQKDTARMKAFVAAASAAWAECDR